MIAGFEGRVGRDAAEAVGSGGGGCGGGGGGGKEHRGRGKVVVGRSKEYRGGI